MKIDLTDIRNMVLESCNKLLLEISNNAIETMIKTAYPNFKNFFDNTLHQMACVNWLGHPIDEPHPAGIYACRSIGISDDIVRQNPNMKVKDCLRLIILKEFGINRGNGPARYLKGIVRICCSDEINMFSENRDFRRLKTFKQLIEFLDKNNIDLDENLNGLTYAELNKTYGSDMRRSGISTWLSNKNKIIRDSSTGRYTVKHIPSYAAAHQYAPYVDWCVTYGENHFNAYTGRGEQFFFCLRDGFENVPREVGDNCPLDEYGLSMVSVCIKPNGEPSYITTRWNHANDGENNVELHTLEQVEEKLGIPSKTFTENIKPEFNIEDTQYLLHNSDLSLDEIFKWTCPTDIGLVVVAHEMPEYEGSGEFVYNIVKDRELMSEMWFYGATARSESVLVENDAGEYNMFDSNGQVFKKFIPTIPRYFNQEKGIFLVKDRQRDVNLINKDGEYLLPHFVDSISDYHEGIAELYQYRDMVNFIDEDCNLLWPEFLPLSIVTPQTPYGNTPLPRWSDGVCIIENSDRQYTYVDIRTGKALVKSMDRWFNECKPFSCGFGAVTKKDKETGEKVTNMVNRQGYLVSEKWFDSISASFDNNFIVYDKELGKNILTSEGKIYFKNWKEDVYFFDGEYGCFKANNNTYSVFNGRKILFKSQMAVYKHFPNDTFLGFQFYTNPFKMTLYDMDGNELVPGGFVPGTRPNAWNDSNGVEYILDPNTGKLTNFDEMEL
jgi:hypothetical protein